MTHTPGPWTQRGTLIVKFGEQGGTICELSELRANAFAAHARLQLGSLYWDEQMANANLIAAAPDLLRSLTFAAETFERMRPGQYVPKRAVTFHEAAAEFRKVIAMATGEVTP